MHQVKSTQFTPTPQPKVKSTTIESTDQIQYKKYNSQINSNSNQVNINSSISKSIDKAMSHLLVLISKRVPVEYHQQWSISTIHKICHLSSNVN